MLWSDHRSYGLNLVNADMDFVLPLSIEHITAIGRVTAYFSLLEQHATAVIADLLELKSGADIVAVTAPMKFLDKIQLIETLANSKLAPQADLQGALLDAVGAMKRVNKRRNEIVHAHWYYYSPSKNESGRLKQTAYGTIKTELEGYTPTHINEVACAIFDVTAKLQQFLLKKNGELRFG